MSSSMYSVLLALTGLAGVVGLVALGLSVSALRALGARRRGAAGSPLPLDVAGLRGEVERLRTEAAGALRHVSVVRYDAFSDMGGRLSWSVALVDDGGGGVVLTSIHGRSEARSYAKSVTGWTGDQQLSPEEETAVEQVRLGGVVP